MGADDVITQTGRRRRPSEEDTALGDVATPAARQRAPAILDADPAQIGRFEVLRRAGKGAMGVVYAAYDAELDRKIAIKLLLTDDAAAPEYAERLRSEARAMAKVVHANVVAVHDVGVCDGRPFIAMDFVDGADVRGWLRTKPDWQQIVDVFVQAAHGLAAAHTEGVIHRDFKPDNVLVTVDRQGCPRARVADFGLASAAAARTARTDPMAVTAIPTGTPTPAASHSGAGTPAYMAPERYEGEPANPRTDLFSLGVSLFEALAGYRPYEGKTIPELVFRMTHGRFNAPPWRSDVPGWIWAAIVRSIDPNPAVRHASMGAFINAITVDPRRNTRRLLAVGAGLASVAVGIGVHMVLDSRARAECSIASEQVVRAIWSDSHRPLAREAFAELQTPHATASWSRAETSLDQYLARWSTARAELCVAHDVDEQIPEDVYAARTACLDLRRHNAEAIIEVLSHPDETVASVATTALRGLPPMDVCAAPNVSDRIPLPSDPREREAALELRKDVVAFTVRRVLARRVDSGLELAEDLDRRAIALGYLPLRAEAAFNLANVQAQREMTEAAEASFSRAAKDAVEGGHTELAADAWLGLLWFVGPKQPARVPDLERAAEVAIEAAPDREAKRAKLESLRGSMRAHAGAFDVAVGHHQRALELWAAAPGDNDLDVATTYNNLGYAFHKQGELADAQRAYERSLSIKERIVGPLHPSIAPTLFNIGMIARERHDPATALVVLRRSLELTTASVGEVHSRTASVVLESAAVLNDLNRADEALRMAQRGKQIAAGLNAAPAWLTEELDAEFQRAQGIVGP